MFSLRGKNALVTGASQGLGRGIAVCLAKLGAQVALVYKSSFDEAANAVQETINGIDDVGGSCMAFDADVTNSAAVDQLRQKVEASFGRIDILVNNVGGYPT